MEKNMRTRLLISFLIIALLTAASPAYSLSGNTALAQAMEAPIPQVALIKLPGLIETYSSTMATFSKASPGCLAPKGIHGRTAPFKVEVFGVKKANVNINGTSRNGNYVIYCSFTIKQGIPVFIELMWGNYVYLVSRGTTTSRGSFFINSFDKATMQVFRDKIKIGPYY
jgi:hypothetical protein